VIVPTPEAGFLEDEEEGEVGVVDDARPDLGGWRVNVGMNGVVVDAPSAAKRGERRGDNEREGTAEAVLIVLGRSIPIRYMNSAARRSARARLKSFCTSSIEELDALMALELDEDDAEVSDTMPGIIGRPCAR